jgi:hypothetical protein
MAFWKFITSEDGAVTVDWVVLSGGIVGVGIAVVSTVSGGIEDLAGDIRTTLVNQEITTRFTEFAAQQLLALDFTGAGIGAWTGGVAADKGGSLGELLMVGPGATAELALQVPPGANQAVFTFDLIGGDSLDSETATVMINGQPVTIGTGNFGTISFENADVPGVTVTTAVQSHGSQLGGRYDNGWNDSVTTVSITLDNPGTNVTLGVMSGANQSTNDEYFGIDNLTVDAS